MLASADPADLDDGPRTAKSGTERMCAVTRQVRPIEDLIRFVVGPDGDVIADLKRKLPGRGLWISATQDAVAEAVRRGVFGRGFKRAVKVSTELPAETERLLARGAVEALAMAGKAGEVITGFTKVEAALQAGETAALIHASDGADDGIRKLDAIARQNPGKAGEIPVLSALTSAELDLALGRSNVIHAALRAGPAAKTVLARCHGVLRFRATPDRRATGTAAHKAYENKASENKASEPRTSTLKDV